MSKLIWPNSRLRIALSFRCNFKCDYCSIDKFQENLCNTRSYHKEEFTADQWIKRLADVVPSRPLSIIFGCGEAGLFPGIGDLVNSISRFGTHVYTNASTKAMEGLLQIKPRDSLGMYISFHPTGIDIDEFIENAKILKEKYILFNIHTPNAPSVRDRLPNMIKKLVSAGLKVSSHHPYLESTKDFYNFYDELGELPKFKNRFASRTFGVPEKTVYCKTSFNHYEGCNTMSYPVAPNGDIYWCWRYLFEHSKEGIIGNFFDKDFKFTDDYFECNHYGDCNMCAWDRNIIDKETGKQLDTDVIGWEYIV